MQRPDKYAELKDVIRQIFTENKGRYGYRRILSVLKQKGYTINHKTVLKLMNELNIKGKQHKNGKYHSYKGEVGKIADNRIKFFAFNSLNQLIGNFINAHFRLQIISRNFRTVD